jgi:hypothetical protein
MRTLIAFVASAAGTLLLIPVLILVAPFWVIAACTRAVARMWEPDHLTRDQLIQFDPVFGWRPRPNLDTYHLMGDLFRIRTDAHGWRGRSSLAASDLVALGDSFAAGYGVSERHLFANLCKQPRVKPIGIGGYSMVQELLWLKALAPSLRGKLIVWFVYFGNDLFDNLSPELRGYRKPFVRECRGTDQWEIVSDHVSAEKWPIVERSRKVDIHMRTLSELCADTFLARRAYHACDFLVREAQQICVAAGADLVILTIPDPNQLTVDGRTFLASLRPDAADIDAELPDRMFAAIGQRTGISVIHGASFLDVNDYKTNDCHWNERGHRAVAAMLTRVFEQREAARLQRHRVDIVNVTSALEVAKSL